MSARASLLIGMLGGSLLGLLCWSIWSFWQNAEQPHSNPIQQAALPQQARPFTPPAIKQLEHTEYRRSQHQLRMQAATPSLPPHHVRCNMLRTWQERAKRIATKVSGISERELFGLQAYPEYSIEDDRPRVGRFRVNDILKIRLVGVSDEDDQLLVLAEYLKELIVTDGLSPDVAFLAASLDHDIFLMMLGDRKASELSIVDLESQHIDGQNYWPDDVEAMVEKTAQSTLTELAENCEN